MFQAYLLYQAAVLVSQISLATKMSKEVNYYLRNYVKIRTLCPIVHYNHT